MKKQFRDDIAANGTAGGEVVSTTTPTSSPSKSATSGSDVLSLNKKGNRVVKRGRRNAKGARGRGKTPIMKKVDESEDEIDEEIEFTSDE